MNKKDYNKNWRKKNPDYHIIYYKNNKDKRRAAVRKSKLKSKYGIDIDTYNKLLQEQNECCAICKEHQLKFKRRLAVDHRHSDGRVRGLLCGNCNRLVGEFEMGKIDKVKQYITKSSI